MKRPTVPNLPDRYLDNDAIDHYGAFDTALDKFGIDQKGPIKQLLT